MGVKTGAESSGRTSTRNGIEASRHGLTNTGSGGVSLGWHRKARRMKNALGTLRHVRPRWDKGQGQHHRPLLLPLLLLLLLLHRLAHGMSCPYHSFLLLQLMMKEKTLQEMPA
jgi:hypothetical protein